MTHHRCIICLGSNHLPIPHMTYAQQALTELWPSIVFEAELHTPAQDMDMDAEPFVNQVAHFNTSLTIDEVKRLCKQIEHNCGRCRAEKEQHIIRMDIDLLIYDKIILKPKQLRWPWLKHLAVLAINKKK